jgi:tetratricopeptide (TPR) repeat protein
MPRSHFEMTRFYLHTATGTHRLRLRAMLLTLLAIGRVYATPASTLDSLKHIVALGREDTITVNAAEELAWELRYEDPALAIQYGLDAVNRAKKLDFERGISRSMQTLGQCYLNAGELDRALECFKTGGLYAQAHGFRKHVFQAYLNAGSAFEGQGDYPQAARAQLQARMMAMEDHNDANVTDCEFNLGITFFRIGNYTAAMDFFSKAKDRFLTAGNPMGFAAALEAMGNVAIAQEDYDSAASCIGQAIALLAPMGPSSNLAPTYLNLGSVYFFQKKYVPAIQNMQLALDLALQTGQLQVEVDCYNNLGNCYRLMGDLTQAEANSLKALKMSKDAGRNHTTMDALGNLVEIYASKDEADKALGYYRELEAMKDSLQVDEAAAEIANLRLKFETDKHAQEILLLQEQANVAESRAEKNELWIFASVAVALALLLALVVGVLYQYTRKRAIVAQIAQRNAEFARHKLELEQRALRAQMNPHFIFNSLNAIQRLYIEGDLDRAGDYMSDFAQILRKILDHSGSERIALAAELETLRLYLRLEEARLEGVLACAITLDDAIDIYNTQLPPLILQPFVENAIWHGILPRGEQGRVAIHISPSLDPEDDTRIMCTITDNGVGIETSLKAKLNSNYHTSKGMHITQERLGVGGTVQAEQLPMGGTKITLIIPVTYA